MTNEQLYCYFIDKSNEHYTIAMAAKKEAEEAKPNLINLDDHEYRMAFSRYNANDTVSIVYAHAAKMVSLLPGYVPELTPIREMQKISFV